MTTKTHSLLTIAAPLVMAVSMTAPYLHAIQREEKSLAVVIPPAVAVALALRFVLRKFVGARCLDGRCPGTMYLTSVPPVAYKCNVCGKTAEGLIKS